MSPRPARRAATASGSGPINELVTLLNGGSATYTVTAAIAPGATGSISNTATVTAPATVVDPNSANNTATDTDTLTPVADLAITKTDGVATYTPGGTATYTIVATNAGPLDAINVTVSDPLPAGVTLTANATCVASGVANCGTVTGTTGQTSFGTTGATVGAGAGNSLTFTVPVAFASGLITNPLINTATVTDPTSPPASASDSDARAAVAPWCEQDRRQRDLHAGRHRDIHGPSSPTRARPTRAASPLPTPCPPA